MEDHEKTPLLYDESSTAIPMPASRHSAADHDGDAGSQTPTAQAMPLHQPKPTYPPGSAAAINGHHASIVGGSGSNSAAPTPPPRTNTPRLLRRRDGRHRMNWPSPRTAFSCFGVTLLFFFLYLTVTSLLHPPPLGPGRRTSIDVALRHILDETIGTQRVWDRLAEMTDLYGPRPSGSPELEKAGAAVRRWQRNEESAQLLLPTRAPRTMPMLGLGGSVGTGPEGIEADVVVVDDIDQLNTMDNATIAGKIVLFDTAWQGYGISHRSRVNGASEAEKYGAVAVLVRSSTPYSLGTPHTGIMYRANIPAAAITTEDADYIRRVYSRYLTAENATSPFKSAFVQPRVRLTMGASLDAASVKTRNIIAEVKGRMHPEQIVVISAHTDSWDVGAGVIDDAAGFFVAWEALRAIATYGIAPRRTVRLVGWVDEEQHQQGASTYFKNRKHEIKDHVFAMEADSGIFQPWGLKVAGTDRAQAILRQIGERFLGEMGSGNVTALKDEVISDLGQLMNAGVPCASFYSLDPITQASPLSADYDGYFRYHHSMGTWAYVLAEMEERIDVEDPDEAAHI
ncbi:hypothetical protein SYNPS1DRAFT_21411 [Syncephalis pseudoplumigaleata]|uniref:Peptide hydrolase n=1 Tax=Syncephalis pseudoplumigaleata TaxID=1712513 RepID=A0A4P9Z3H7_9FUNG|nr:hypothetical protein SYNPS1DRAFT_21411 [Syncephalis pseudoplumigaleata]|eukprot:RKP26938.1 hypothetical protein SYNPS1DRAFT_21411 [Syncephalis pseudoplumigaleata]